MRTTQEETGHHTLSAGGDVVSGRSEVRDSVDRDGLAELVARADSWSLESFEARCGRLGAGLELLGELLVVAESLTPVWNAQQLLRDLDRSCCENTFVGVREVLAAGVPDELDHSGRVELTGKLSALVWLLKCRLARWADALLCVPSLGGPNRGVDEDQVAALVLALGGLRAGLEGVMTVGFGIDTLCDEARRVAGQLTAWADGRGSGDHP
jgi:hypothetical protein